MTTPAPASPTVVADDMQFLALAYSWASALNGMATELPAPYGHLRDLITPSDLTWFGNSTPMSVRNGLSVGIRRAVHDQNDPNQVGVEIRVFPPEVQIPIDSSPRRRSKACWPPSKPAWKKQWSAAPHADRCSPMPSCLRPTVEVS